MITETYDTICAISTPHGTGAIAMVRISGSEAITITDRIFVSKQKDKKLIDQKGNTLHFGTITNGVDDIDEVVVSLFRAPRSFTGDDTIEISCHGSLFIQQSILQVIIDNGARMARPGEFTQRAFLNGKMDLCQAEAIADLIASQSKVAHKVAMKQMRGGISDKIALLRDKLLNFTSLIELELDFSEEDVNFADRSQLKDLVNEIDGIISNLVSSFKYGNAIKNGIPIAIIGNTNVGKSTLLNVILNEDRAIVSDIAGTTRDVIEETLVIEGLQFRFIDTAGIRNSVDTIENLGIERTFTKIEQSEIVLTIIDATSSFNDIVMFLTMMSEHLQKKRSILVINKIDKADEQQLEGLMMLCRDMDLPTVQISAKLKKNFDTLSKLIVEQVKNDTSSENDVIITNMRHYEAFCNAQKAIKRVSEGLDNHISGDFLSQDIRECIYHLGEITGQISTEEVLGNIFKNFCIGK